MEFTKMLADRLQTEAEEAGIVLNGGAFVGGVESVIELDLGSTVQRWRVG